jgi:hypothetical protein
VSYVNAKEQWKRNSTGEVVTVTSVGMSWDPNRKIVSQGKRRVFTGWDLFVKNYTKVSDAPADETSEPRTS